MKGTGDNETLATRLTTELKRYAVISAYLFVCFGVILVYEESQSPAKDVTWLTIGIALAKALVMGKFVLVGVALKPGTRISAPTLLHRVAWRTLGMLIVLIIFKLIEEFIVGLLHSRSIGELVAELGQASWLSLVAPILLMLLILIPMMFALELDRALGEKGLKGLFLDRQQ